MRRATLLAAGVLALGSLGVPAFAAPDDVPDTGSAELDRVQGETRYHTAADTAVTANPDGADTVLVATGENFPDALASSYLAGRESVDSPYPILLTHPTFLPGPTQEAIAELDPSQVIILGQTNAVNRDVQRELEGLVDDVRRIGGDDRVQTAAEIARRGGDTIGTAPNLSDEESEEDLVTVIVARADNFPDALASGPLALEGRHPILLTDTGTLPAATRDVLTDGDLGIEQVIVAGGPSAVNENVVDEIAGLENIQSVARVQGEVRTETAVRMAELTRAALGWSAENISLARGDLYPDALTLAPLAAIENASMYLTGDPSSLSAETFRGIQDICDENDRILISGGPDAVSDQAAGEAKQASLCATEFAIDAEQSAYDDDGGKPGAEGTGWYTVVGDTICVAYDVDGLEGAAEASHIHEGAEGETGEVVVDLGAPNPQGFLATCVTDAEQAAAIAATPTDYYVNIHTSDFPQGAARGQLVEPTEEPAEPEIAVDEDFTVFGAAVDGGDAAYTAGATLEPSEDSLELCLTVADEDDAVELTGAQLYAGAVDQDAQGDALATWEDLTEGEQSCTTPTSPEALGATFEGDQYHLVVDDADGAVARGQVAPTAETTLMDGDTEVEGSAAELFRGADSANLCVHVNVGGLTLNEGEAIVVNDAEDAVVADVVAGSGSWDYECADDATDAEADSITVPVNEGGGTLSGEFGEAPAA